jgi:hypothetical protein
MGDSPGPARRAEPASGGCTRHQLFQPERERQHSDPAALRIERQHPSSEQGEVDIHRPSSVERAGARRVRDDLAWRFLRARGSAGSQRFEVDTQPVPPPGTAR